jgi:hypothetical protein
MYVCVITLAHYLDVFNPTTDFLAVAFVFPFATLIMMFKTVFPRIVRHRSYSLASYLFLSQLLATSFCAALLVAIGECLTCTGNIHDLIFYGIALGTPYGLLYAFFSKIFSINVDTSQRGV